MFSEMQIPVMTYSDNATQKILAPTQETLIAKQAYALGDLFIYNNGLYKATSAINSGAAITIGSSGNAEASSKTVVEELNASVKRTPVNCLSRLKYLRKVLDGGLELEAGGMKIGDYFDGPVSGFRYWLGDRGTYYGGYNNMAIINQDHVAIVVDTKDTCKYLASGSFTAYGDTTLQKTLRGTVNTDGGKNVWNLIKQDIEAIFGDTWSNHIIPNYKLYSKYANSSWNRDWYKADGTNNTQEYIVALSELEVYGTLMWSETNYQQGEAVKQLEIFRKYRFNQIFGHMWIWLRNCRSNATLACGADYRGTAGHAGFTYSARASGLILLR